MLINRFLSGPRSRVIIPADRVTQVAKPGARQPERHGAHGGVARRRTLVRTFLGWALLLPFLPVVAVVLGILFSGPATANTPPVLDGHGNMTCTTDQSSGIKITGTDYNPAVTTLNVYGLTGPINPGVGDPGISLTNGSSLNATINSGNASTPGNISISVTNSYGISAQSQGSNGSDGQDATLFTGSTPGGGGANAGNVTVNTINTSIATAGANAIGILAVSQGGNGGRGGNGVVFSGASHGGSGGNAGTVNVSGSGRIATAGDYSHGILATSRRW